MWGCTATDVRGRLVEEVVNQLNLNIINDGNPLLMIINDGTESCIDLSIVSPRPEPITQWSVDASPNDSDQYPSLSISWKIDLTNR